MWACMTSKSFARFEIASSRSRVGTLPPEAQREWPHRVMASSCSYDRLRTSEFVHGQLASEGSPTYGLHRQDRRR